MESKYEKLKHYAFFSEKISDVNLRGISTSSSQVAWVSGDKGTLLHTIDQGNTWELDLIPDTKTLEFRDVKAFGKKTAYVMSSGSGQASRIYKTTDAGDSWELQLEGNNPQEFFNCMAFWTSDHGMVLSDPVDGKFRLYVTQNGGKTWLPTPEAGMPVALKGEGAFAASGSCLTVQGQLNAWFGTGVNTARVFYTVDGGSSWQVVNTPLLQDSATSGVFSIAFSNLKDGVIVGGDYKNPKKGGENLAITHDGGLSWKLAEIAPQFYWSAISFSPDRKNIMVVGSNHCGITESKSAEQWRQSYDVSLNALAFWSPKKALAVGPKGAILQIEIAEDCDNSNSLKS